jgi:hypothetical protein
MPCALAHRRWQPRSDTAVNGASRYNHRMTTALDRLDDIMERASRALAEMDYLACESLCLEALAQARDTRRYGHYARVLLPLQEARRQRRMIAAQGEVRLGGAEPGFDADRWLTEQRAGCIVLTRPRTAKDARAFAQRARSDKRFIEVLFADNAPEKPKWTLRSYDGPEVVCEVDRPAPDQDPAQWFLHATEKLGDAALRSVDGTLRGEALILDLESRLRVFPDHELLHQRLADAARGVG